MTRVRVLVVDDEAAVTGYIVEMLMVHGIDARGFTDAPAALVHLRENSYDVLILDVRMPTMNGIELLRRLREFNRELPVILIAANPALPADAGEVNRVELGIAAQLRKPFLGADLRQAIANIAGCGYRG